MSDELDVLFVDKNEPADKKIIVEILKDMLTIDKGGIIGYSDKYNALKECEKAAVYLVARKVMVIKGMLSQEAAGPTEVSKGACINLSSAKSALTRDLIGIARKEGKGYIIPNYSLRKTLELLNND